MTADEFRDALTRLGLSQVQAAPVLGVTARCVRHYAGGTRPVAPPVVLLLRALEQHPVVAKAAFDVGYHSGQYGEDRTLAWRHFMYGEDPAHARVDN